MSTEQRKVIGDVTLWVLRVSLGVAGFLAVDEFKEIKKDVHHTRNEVMLIRERVIRLETKLEK